VRLLPVKWAWYGAWRRCCGFNSVGWCSLSPLSFGWRLAYRALLARRIDASWRAGDDIIEAQARKTLLIESR